MKIERLYSIINSSIPSAFDESESWLEFLGKVYSKVNEVVDLANDYFKGDLRTIVYDRVNELKDSGEFQTIIDNFFFTEVKEKIDTLQANVNDNFTNLQNQLIAQIASDINEKFNTQNTANNDKFVAKAGSTSSGKQNFAGGFDVPLAASATVQKEATSSKEIINKSTCEDLINKIFGYKKFTVESMGTAELDALGFNDSGNSLTIKVITNNSSYFPKNRGLLIHFNAVPGSYATTIFITYNQVSKIMVRTLYDGVWQTPIQIA